MPVHIHASPAPHQEAEQALRPAVVYRKVSGGNRSRRGADTQQVLTSVIQMTRLRGLDSRAVFVDLLRAVAGGVSRPLSSRTQPSGDLQRHNRRCWR